MSNDDDNNSSGSSSSSSSGKGHSTIGTIGPFTIKGTMEAADPLPAGGLEVVAKSAQRLVDQLPPDARVLGCMTIVVLDDPSGAPHTAMDINSWSAGGAFGLATGLVAAMDQLEHIMPGDAGEDADIDIDDDDMGWC